MAQILEVDWDNLDPKIIWWVQTSQYHDQTKRSTLKKLIMLVSNMEQRLLQSSPQKFGVNEHYIEIKFEKKNPKKAKTKYKNIKILKNIKI